MLANNALSRQLRKQSRILRWVSQHVGKNNVMMETFTISSSSHFSSSVCRAGLQIPGRIIAVQVNYSRTRGLRYDSHQRTVNHHGSSYCHVCLHNGYSNLKFQKLIQQMYDVHLHNIPRFAQHNRKATDSGS